VLPKWEKPPVRQLILPDKGKIIADCDLSGADAQVVAWEANEKELKSAFRAGLDIHNFNGNRLWGTTYDPKKIRRKLTWRDECKRGVHGTNYLVSERELAKILGWKIVEVRAFQSGYLRTYPGILNWQREVDAQIQSSKRGVSNKFGFSITYFDRPSNILPKALAWIPQSTVAITCSKGAINLRKYVPWVEILLQVHDSLVFQFPNHRHSIAGYRMIRDALRVIVPYEDPLEIPWGMKLSERSWGHAEKVTWQELQAA
jgi:DNA polymerase I-like protein with 3'-5' exonuclease and polymerase domains